jgi:hypothetical protein
LEQGENTQFRGFDVVEALTYHTTTSSETVCDWCPVNCQRTFIDVETTGAKGRAWSKVSLREGWERVITNNSCPKGMVEDINELKAIKAEMDKAKNAYPNIGELVHKEAFRTSAL